MQFFIKTMQFLFIFGGTVFAVYDEGPKIFTGALITLIIIAWAATALLSSLADWLRRRLRRSALSKIGQSSDQSQGSGDTKLVRSQSPKKLL